MAGVKTFAEVTLTIDNKPITKVQGDILFASYGISGLAILDISQRASYALMKHQKVGLILNLLPRFDEQTLRSTLDQLFATVPHHPIEVLLSTLLPAKTIPHLCEAAAINPSKICL